MKSIRELLRRLGPLNAVLFAADQLLRRASGGRAKLVKYYFVAQAVPRGMVAGARSGGISVAEMRERDPRVIQLDRPAAELERRFGSGCKCLAAWQGDALAGFLWFTEQPYVEEEVRCAFETHPMDRAVWDLDVHVMPRYRLSRTFALLWDAGFEAMRARGKRWTISRISAFNVDSLRAHQRLGAQRTGWACFALLGDFQITLTSLGQLRCGRHEHGSYPAIQVRAPVTVLEDDRGDAEKKAAPLPKESDESVPSEDSRSTA